MRIGIKEYVYIVCRYFLFLVYFVLIFCICCSIGLRIFVIVNWINNYDKNIFSQNVLQDVKYKVGLCKYFKFFKQFINVSLEYIGIFKLLFK